MSKLSDAINDAFYRAYPRASEDPVRTENEDLLAKRVRMLIDDLLVARQNWRISERAYNRLDCEKRNLRWHWWQIWKPTKAKGT